MAGRTFVSTFTLLAALAALPAAPPKAMAELPPVPNTSAELAIHYMWPADPCGDADLVWAPGPPSDSIVIYVTVRNELDQPVPACSLRLDVEATATPEPSIGAGTLIKLCGWTDPSSYFAETDANGAAAFPLRGGGCGRIALDWTIVALCAGPEVEIYRHQDTLCVKSGDFNGDLRVQFIDTFKFLPMLTAGTGYCGDLNCDGEVTFNDVFRILPLIGTAPQCLGLPAPEGNLGSCEP